MATNQFGQKQGSKRGNEVDLGTPFGWPSLKQWDGVAAG